MNRDEAIALARKHYHEAYPGSVRYEPRSEHHPHAWIIAAIMEAAERAEAERDAAIKDAERYRWLRSEEEGVEFRDCTGVWRSDAPNRDELDAGVDAAIAAQKEGK